jgi:hypothetical protein
MGYYPVPRNVSTRLDADANRRNARTSSRNLSRTRVTPHVPWGGRAVFSFRTGLCLNFIMTTLLASRPAASAKPALKALSTLEVLSSAQLPAVEPLISVFATKQP